MKRVRWACPNGCAAVLASTRPRRDDIARYCLACSKRTGRLVLRTAPTLDSQREVKAELRKVLAKRAAERAEEKRLARFMVCGVDLQTLMRQAWFSDTAKPFREKYRHYLKDLPLLKVRRCRDNPRSMLGHAQGKLITVFAYPKQTAEDVRETMLHEVAHVLTPNTHHGTAWRTCFRLLCEEILGVRPKLDVRWHGEVSDKLRAAAKETEMTHPMIRALVQLSDETDGKPVHVFRAPEDPLEGDERMCNAADAKEARVVYHVEPKKEPSLHCTSCSYDAGALQVPS